MASESGLYDLLVVSDLHLSEGRHPDTKKFSLNEDFFFDEEFARFLAYYANHARWPGKKWRLIINGDFLDFLQVTAYQDAPAGLSRDPDHPEYGLGCGEQETVYKLGKIVDGHWLFFEALAEFVAEGHALMVGKGNHDVEFCYPAVRAALIDKLRRVYQDKFARAGKAADPAKLACLNDDSVRFIDWFYYEKGLLWVEHGNQYDELNCFKYWLAPLLPQAPGSDPQRQNEIDLPWGSLFVRYLFNRIESQEPFADNIKPLTGFIRWFLTTRPTLALRFLFGDGRYMLKKMARCWEPVSPEAYQQRKAAHEKRLAELASESGIRKEDLEYVDGLRAPNVLKEPAGRWKVIGWFTRHWRFSLLIAGILLLVVVLGGALVAALLLVPAIPSVLRQVLWDSWAGSPAGQQFLGVLRWLLLPIVAAAILLVLRRIFAKDGPEGRSYLAERAEDICRRLDVRYVLMGHTHDTDLQVIPACQGEYFNTGTWTKVFSTEAERLVREESELVFAQAVREAGGLKVKLLKWNDGAGEPRLVKLFE